VRQPDRENSPLSRAAACDSSFINSKSIRLNLSEFPHSIAMQQN
jgi:hypothetical protein